MIDRKHNAFPALAISISLFLGLRQVGKQIFDYSRVIVPHENRGLGTRVGAHLVRPTGVLHVGGHHGEEADYYDEFDVETVVWFEADPDAFAVLQENTGHRPGHHCIQALVTDRDDEERAFFRHRFGTGIKRGFCSTLPFKQDVVRASSVLSRLDTFEVMRISSVTLATSARAHNFAPESFQYLSLNVQGAEQLVLMGMREFLDSICWIYCDGEPDEASRYEGAPTISELTLWLSGCGFEAAWPVVAGSQFYFRTREAARIR